LRRLLLILALLPQAALAQPSFDCANASSTVEKAICEDANYDIAARDAAMSRLYSAVKGQGGHEALLAGQKEWLSRRDACDSDRDCLSRVYDERLAELASAAGDEQGVTGAYGYALEKETNFGSAVIIREADGTLSGNIDTVSGPTYHTCGVSFDGARPIGQSWLWEAPPEDTVADDGPCRVLFTPAAGNMRIDSLDCRAYCGARGWFDETYERKK
jgi:uncharacterized protein